MKVTIKDNEFTTPRVRDSFYRRSISFKNKIIQSLRKLGLTEDDVEIVIERAAMKRVPASASWYMEGYFLNFTYAKGVNYAENLAIVAKVIELEVEKVLSGKRSISEFCHEFEEHGDVVKQRKEARKTLGVDEDELDLLVINKKYKDLAKKLHPDMESGDVNEFKAINRAHKILKKELS